MRPLVQAALAVGVLGAAGAAAGYWALQREAVLPGESPVVLPLVEVVDAHPSPIRLSVTAHGSVQPVEISRLSSEVAARVVFVHPQLVRGGRIAEGEVLIELEATRLEEVRALAAAEVSQAELSLALEQREARVAEREWRATSEGEPDPLLLRVPQLATARARLESARATLARSERDLDQARVRAPFAARVREELVAVGDWVAVGQELATLIRTDIVEVPLPLTGSQLDLLEPRALESLLAGGAPEVPLEVLLQADAAGGLRSWPAEIVRASGELDGRTRMLELVARVEQEGASGDAGTPLLSGQLVTAKIQGRLLPAAVRLPRSALVDDQSILVVGDDDRLRQRRVVIASGGSEELLVENGVAEGERVCISPLAAPVDGMRVRLLASDAAEGPDDR